MRSRLSLYLNDLTLEELMYFEEEIQQRKQKHTRQYSVLSVQSERALLTQNPEVSLISLARDMRRFLTDCAAVGGGSVLAFSPELSILLFNEIEQASRSCSALFAGLPELNGRGGNQSYKIGLKLGVATGVDTLSPGSPRSIRASKVVRRANQCAWRSSNGVVLIDDPSYQTWPGKYTAMRMAFSVDEISVYRVIPTSLGTETDNFDNSSLQEFLETARKHGLITIKYDLVHLDHENLRGGAWSKAVEVTELVLQAYDPGIGRNVSYSEKIAARNFADRMESIKRHLSTMGFALLRNDIEANVGA